MSLKPGAEPLIELTLLGLKKDTWPVNKPYQSSKVHFQINEGETG